jgi:hypothetical protein
VDNKSPLSPATFRLTRAHIAGRRSSHGSLYVAVHIVEPTIIDPLVTEPHDIIPKVIGRPSNMHATARRPSFKLATLGEADRRRSNSNFIAASSSPLVRRVIV